MGSPNELLDLRLLPAWATEPARPNEYADFEGEAPDRRENRREPRGHDRRRPPQRRDQSRDGKQRPRDRREREPRRDRPQPAREREPVAPLAIDVRFIPHPPVFESVITQIKATDVAYSLFALARLFLEKPERYDVRLTATGESQMHQLGDNGSVALDQRVLESNAFTTMAGEFFNIETTQTEPPKGNFASVARDRVTGTLLGPTNFHGYQPRLRSLYEQRFSRRMSFPDFQRQIEIVNDAAAVEQWKEEVRSVTTYATKNEEPPVTFTSAAEAERFFRQKYLPGLLHTTREVTVAGVPSRTLPDRALRRGIEDAWVRETRSPSRMMQELASRLREGGLHLFRHRRGMLFVGTVRPRPFAFDREHVSASVNALIDKIAATPGISRKQLADELVVANGDPAQAEQAKRALATDLRWLVSAGYVIEFNDGTLDLPRAKAPQPQAKSAAESEPAITPEEQAIASDEVQQNSAAPPASEENVGVEVTESIEPTAEPIASNEVQQHSVPSPVTEENAGVEVTESIEPVATPSSESA